MKREASFFRRWSHLFFPSSYRGEGGRETLKRGEKRWGYTFLWFGVCFWGIWLDGRQRRHFPLSGLLSSPLPPHPGLGEDIQSISEVGCRIQLQLYLPATWVGRSPDPFRDVRLTSLSPLSGCLACPVSCTRNGSERVYARLLRQKGFGLSVTRERGRGKEISVSHRREKKSQKWVCS